MSNPKPDEETDEYVKFNQSVTFTEDYKIEKKLIVAGNIVAENIDAENIVAGNIDARDIDARNIVAWVIVAGNIDARNIDAWDIVARNIDARDIVARNIDARNIVARNIDARNIVLCETVKVESKIVKTKTLITKRSEIEYKEWAVNEKHS